jgi:hypothetical protein
MKRILVTIGIILFCIQESFNQSNEGLIELGKAYRQFMFRNNPPSEFLETLTKYDNTDLAYPAKFIREAISPKNKIFSEEFLKRPSDKDLKYIYIIERINYNIRKEKSQDNNELIKELEKKEIPSQVLLDSYYAMLCMSNGNKNQPFDLSATNVNLNNLELKDETEKSIFFLEMMKQCGTQIWGYMNVVKPPNYALALEYINKYPKFNSLPYYQIIDLNFSDFKMNITSENKQQSFKEYYIDKYYETLLYHLACLRETNQGDDKIYDLMLGSLLKEQMYYKYSSKEKELKELFTKYKK